MRASIGTRLDKLNRRLPPTWRDLTRGILTAGETMNQAEVSAVLAHVRGHSTAKQEALWDEWIARNLPRIWAVWDEKYPGWQDAPFWKEHQAAGHSENTDNEEC